MQTIPILSGAIAGTTINLVKTREDFDVLLEFLNNSSAIGFDIETTGLFPRESEISLLQFSDGESIFIVDAVELEGRYNRSDIPPMRPSGKKGVIHTPESEEWWSKYTQSDLLKLLIPFLESTSIKKIIQNLKFESSWAQEKIGCDINGAFDTFIGARLLDTLQNYKLDTLLHVYLGVAISKEEQLSDWSSSLMQEQYEYAARDVYYLPELRKKILEKLRQEEMLEIAGIEFNAVRAVSKMENMGIPLDVKMYSKLVEELTVRRDIRAKELEDILNKASGKTITTAIQGGLFGEDKVIKTGGINLNSPAQMKEAFEKLGVHLPSTDKQIVNRMLASNPKLKYLTDYRAAQILVTSFGQKMLDAVDKKTGRIHPTFHQMQVVTGRFSCANPNIQQQPHTKEFRECYRPLDDNRTFVISDYSTLELRILAQLSQDEVMIEAFNNDKDPHSRTAKLAFNLSCDEADVKKLHPEVRQKGKILNFSVVYGAGAQKYADNVGVTFEEGKKSIRGFYNTYKGITKYLYSIEDFGVKNRYIRTLGGRKIKLYFDPNDEKQVAMAKRNARNYPIQGTTGDILKVAIYLLYTRLSGFKDAWVINIVHDEILIECYKEDAYTVKNILSQCMLEAAYTFIKDVKMEAEANICTSWAEK